MRLAACPLEDSYACYKTALMCIFIGKMLSYWPIAELGQKLSHKRQGHLLVSGGKAACHKCRIRDGRSVCAVALHDALLSRIYVFVKRLGFRNHLLHRYTPPKKNLATDNDSASSIE